MTVKLTVFEMKDPAYSNIYADRYTEPGSDEDGMRQSPGPDMIWKHSSIYRSCQKAYAHPEDQSTAE